MIHFAVDVQRVILAQAAVLWTRDKLLINYKKIQEIKAKIPASVASQ